MQLYKYLANSEWEVNNGVVSESLVVKLEVGCVKTFTSKVQLSQIQQSDQEIPMLLLFSRGRCLEMT